LRGPWNNNRGLTLIEVLAATVLLSLAVIIFVQFSSYSTLADRKSDYRESAVRLAEKETNRLLALYDETTPALSTVQAYLPNIAFEGKRFDVEYRDYPLGTAAFERRSDLPMLTSMQAIILCQDGSTLVPRLLQVTVSWRDAP